MNILILGGGQVGGTLALQLADEQNNVTVVDVDNDRLQQLTKQVDIKTVCGMASHPNVLIEAGIEDADMLVAVTVSDEINIVACQIAHSMFNTPKKISRIRASAYINQDALFGDSHIPIDVIITPEGLVTEYLRRLLQHPGALQVLNFAGGKVKLVAVKARRGGPIVGEQLQAIRKHIPGVDTRVAAIFRKDRAILPTSDTVVEDGDEVFFIAAQDRIRPVMSELQPSEKRYRRIIIAGGGNIGERLAQNIESDFKVKIIEQRYSRCRDLSEHLRNTIVIHGNSSDDGLLEEANIEDCDVFIALTNDDQANIMASLLAKRMGCRKVITLITNSAYVDLVQGGEIDIAFSPQQITIGRLLRHVRRGDVSTVHSLRRGAAEAMEVVAHGDRSTSQVVGRRIMDLAAPEGVQIGAIVRGDEVIIAHKQLVVEAEDHVILFLTDKNHTKVVEKLFRVGVGFFR